MEELESGVPSLGLVQMLTVCQRWSFTTSCLQWLVFLKDLERPQA